MHDQTQAVRRCTVQVTRAGRQGEHALAGSTARQTARRGTREKMERM